MNSERLDGLTFELALLLTKRSITLFPPGHVPLPWLRELVAEAYPSLAALPRLLEGLVSVLFSQGILGRENDLAEVAYAEESSVRHVRNNMEEDEVAALKVHLRDFCTRKLDKLRADEQLRINRAMTGDPATAVTAWTVPDVEVVRPRVAEDDGVMLVEFGDGSYSVRAKHIPAWEHECLKAFVAQEFAADDLEGVDWSLRTSLLRSNELSQAEARIDELVLRNPEGLREAMVAGRYWLSRAHTWYGEGWSCRGAWSLAGKAVDILQRFCDRHPDEPEVATLLAEAKQAHWSYDD